MVKVNVSTKVALQQLHECEGCGHDHLENVIRRLTDQFTRRGFEIEHTAQEGSGCDEKLGEVVASGIGA